MDGPLSIEAFRMTWVSFKIDLETLLLVICIKNLKFPTFDIKKEKKKKIGGKFEFAILPHEVRQR